MRKVSLILLAIVCAEDECETGSHTCTENEECFDTYGGYLCICREGFELTGLGCQDVNECQNGESNCHAAADCINHPGGFSCTCKNGYYGFGTYCTDNDEW